MCAADGVAVELHHVEAFGGDALAGEGRVAVDQDRHALVPLVVVAEPLLGAGPAEDDGIGELQVRGIGREGDPDRLAAVGGEAAGVPLVVLHVAAALDEVLLPGLLEFGEDLVVGLVQDVHEHVQPAAVGHGDRVLLDSVRRPVLGQFVEHGDERLAAVEAEPLLAAVPGLQEVLEAVGLDELPQDPELLPTGEFRAIADRLHLLLQPAAAGPVLDVHVLHADVAAVGVLEQGDDLAERGLAVQRQVSGVEGLPEILLREPEASEGQVLRQRPLGAQRVEVRVPVPDVAVVVDQRVHATLGGVGGPGDRRLRDRGHGRSGRGLAVGVGELGAELEALEERPPLGSDRVRILLPPLVLLVHPGGVPAVHGEVHPLIARHRRTPARAFPGPAPTRHSGLGGHETPRLGDAIGLRRPRLGRGAWNLRLWTSDRHGRSRWTRPPGPIRTPSRPSGGPRPAGSDRRLPAAGPPPDPGRGRPATRCGRARSPRPAMAGPPGRR